MYVEGGVNIHGGWSYNTCRDFQAIHMIKMLDINYYHVPPWSIGRT